MNLCLEQNALMPTHNETSQSAPLMRGTLKRASVMSKGKDTMTSTGV